MSDTPKAAQNSGKCRLGRSLETGGGLGPDARLEARRHIDEPSRKYTGQDYAPPVGPQGRVILKITPDKVNTPRLLAR